MINGVAWCTVSHKSTAQWVVEYQRCPDWLRSGKRGELKNWMLEQPLNIREFYKEYKKVLLKKFFRVSVSWNLGKFCSLKYKNFWGGFRLPKYEKSFLLRKYKRFLNISAGKSHFTFLSLVLKSVPGNCILYYWKHVKANEVKL